MRINVVSSGQGDVRFHALTNLAQHVAQLEHSLEFRPISLLTKLGMVAVLLAAATIARGNLQVAVLVGTNPDIGPRRRNHESAKPF